MNTQDKKTELLKTFFGLTCAAFEFARSVRELAGGSGEIEPMHKLHIKALDEAGKEEPNPAAIDALILLMEVQAFENAKKKGRDD